MLPPRLQPELAAISLLPQAEPSERSGLDLFAHAYTDP